VNHAKVINLGFLQLHKVKKTYLCLTPYNDIIMLHGQRFPWMADKYLKRCPIDYAFKIIGKKFTLLIIRNMLLYNQTRFSEFEESIEKINPKILSIRLREVYCKTD
jgi:HxlR-like helix-turn-helix